ncbi:MAG: integration host factor subunit alpha [Deltaproteobacteria bacterium]|jgi:integration host factor subunit alpha|nr:integration host factor subunit alpha [Deltaproteobacteria bacterium]
MTLTKEKLIRRLAEATDKPLPLCADILDRVLIEMKECLQAGQDVLISGFGKFMVVEKQPRKGRNPQTNTPIELGPRKVVTFKPSTKLRDYMNDE